jgi:uncharacterized membrane protein HdeD (DUF308 family)
MSVTSFSREDIRRWTAGWWVLMAVGVFSIAAGVIVLAKPGNSLEVLAVVAGIFILVDGVFMLASSFSSETENRGLAALLGVLGVIVGAILVRHPIAGVAAVAILIGLWLLAAGVVRIAIAFAEPDNRAWRLVLGVIETIAGIVIIGSPGIGFATLALLTGISFLVNGIALFMLGWRVHAVREEVAPQAPRATPVT